MWNERADTHAAEVARLTASRDDWKARSESFDRQGFAVQRKLDAAREEVARLRGALEAMTAKVKEAHVALGADGGITEIECSCEFCSEVPR